MAGFYSFHSGPGPRYLLALGMAYAYSSLLYYVFRKGDEYNVIVNGDDRHHFGILIGEPYLLLINKNLKNQL